MTLKLQDYPSLTHIVLHVPVVNGIKVKFIFQTEFSEMKCEYPKWLYILYHGEIATTIILFCLTIAAINAENWYFIFIMDEAFAWFQLQW